MTTNIIDRVRASGKCSPSLLRDDTDNDFDAAVVNVVDANGTELNLSSGHSGPSVPEDFKKVLEMASNLENISGDPDSKKATLISRRCIILTLVASTPTENTTLGLILQNGYLSEVKLWMDDILKGLLGGIDLLLHLLTSISQLPVTKSVVKESGLGRAIGTIEKHKICAGSPNEVAIAERVGAIKDAWHKSVKARKDKPQNKVSTTDNKSSSKRELENSSLQSFSPTTKKIKLVDPKKSSFSSLLKKVAPPSSDKSSTDGLPSVANSDVSKKVVSSKSKGMRLKWKDHFGGKLTFSNIPEEGETKAGDANDIVSSGSAWKDRQKRDRIREKEIVAKYKKRKLLDDDDDDVALRTKKKAHKLIQATVAWHMPLLLPEHSDAPPPQNNSKEKLAQMTRMASVESVRYASEANVPNNPTPLSDIEQALDMTSQSSTVTQTIPFFVPQEPVAPAPAPQTITASTPAYPLAPAAQPASGIANAETVTSLGLPMFLVGQSLQALQTLAGTPKLLSSFVDNNGMYDQVRLMNLVQTLSQNSPSSGQQQQSSSTVYQQPAVVGHSAPGTGTYGQPPGAGGIYGTASSMNKYGPVSTNQGPYGNSNNWQGDTTKTAGYRGTQNSSEGNLHLSGYGPSTTQPEIIALFSPYVQVREVVMKGTFCFVNTDDSSLAKQAREALNGALLGGTPVRINMAQRKNRDANHNAAANTASYYGNHGNHQAPRAPNAGFAQPHAPPPPAMGGHPPQGQGQGQGQAGNDVSLVRDDRGNAATKNLFVAGFGQGTTEQQLRELFAAHTHIVAIISKGTFSFINTTDKAAAVHTRSMLSGTMLNGGVLRINFAKESGRLGTSFDSTYGNGERARAQSQSQSRSQPQSHYGR
mmetsp:Transcript_10086/g.11611  ORF Transcript_10086/g.11611 Transcript_10086/m.11611 type:complete len:871 (+) Transcript_10086:59-2671(+)